LGAPLELIYVLDHDELPALPRHGPARDPQMREELYKLQEQHEEASARAEIDAAASSLPADDVAATVLTGSPVEVLRRRAQERDAALLVSGTAARHGLEHVLHRSVAFDLAAVAPRPLVAVPPGAALREPGPVLVGDDGSEHGRRAVRHAEALAGLLERELVPVYVVDGDPVEELARTARERRACLAVAGTRGRGPLRGEILGSVSTGLVRTAGRPVVLVSQGADPPA
jgi:nucleotide-binding universal stress UspA family protein